MDLRKLEIFAVVAREGSFTRAAAALHLAQPAVSIAVRKLEASLDCTLFERGTRQTTLTADGRRVLEQAVEILDRVGELRTTMGARRGLLEGEIVIACPSMLATYYLPELLGDFLSQFPGLTASVTQAGTRAIESMLLDDRVELGITTLDGDGTPAELEVLPLVRVQIVVCVADDHPWAGRARLPVTLLDGVPMVAYDGDYSIRQRLDALCAARGVRPQFRLETNFLPLITTMVRQGVGCTVGLDLLAEQEPGLTGLPLTPRQHLTLAIAKRSGRRISRANQAFMDWVADQRG